MASLPLTAISPSAQKTSRTSPAIGISACPQSASRRIALLKVSLAGAVTALGGIAGYFLVSQLHDGLPFFLTVAASSFIYVALADLIPQLQRHLSARETVQQIVWLLLGMGMVMLVSSVAHSHAH